MTRQTRRYSVSGDSTTECTMTVYETCVLGEAGAVFEFWAPKPGGYVRDVSDPARPGTLGPQVCEQLASRGSTLTAPMRTPLATMIRREARAALRSAEREERRARGY